MSERAQHYKRDLQSVRPDIFGLAHPFMIVFVLISQIAILKITVCWQVCLICVGGEGIILSHIQRLSRRAQRLADGSYVPGLSFPPGSPDSLDSLGSPSSPCSPAPSPATSDGEQGSEVGSQTTPEKYTANVDIQPKSLSDAFQDAMPSDVVV